MSPQDLHRTAVFLRERYSPPSSAMEVREYLSHEAMHALADALDRTGDAVADTGLHAAPWSAPRPDDALVLREALDAAVRSLRGDETNAQIVERGRSFADFLRNAPAAPRTSTEGDGGAPDEMHALMDFVWSRTSGDVTTLRSFSGDDEQREALSYLAEYGDELLRWVQHVSAVVGNVAFSVERERRA